MYSYVRSILILFEMFENPTVCSVSQPGCAMRPWAPGQGLAGPAASWSPQPEPGKSYGVVIVIFIPIIL